MTYAFAAAGTGGHVYPALAVADALVEDGVPRHRVVFVGGDRMEAVTVPEAGYRFVQVPLRGLRRSLTPGNLAIPAVVWRAAAQIGATLDDSGVRAVAVFGGYVSVPAAIAARRRRVGVVLHEQNAVPGLANRVVSGRVLGGRRVRRLVAFPAGRRRLGDAEVVGNPLRPELARFDRSVRRTGARRRYRLPDDVAVLGIMGGSQGARELNDLAERIADGLDPERTAILHLTGDLHHDAVVARAHRSTLTWRTLAFETEMEHFYAATDVVLSRGGALTVSELAATGTPAVVVPLVAHQAANAAHLAERGGVVMVPREDLDRVPVEVEQLMVDGERRRRMGAINMELARPDAARRMATVLRETAGG